MQFQILQHFLRFNFQLKAEGEKEMESLEIYATNFLPRFQ